MLFLRSRAGTDRVTCLWVYDAGSGDETVVADPRALLAQGEEDLSPEERARRERAREGAAGIVGYSADDAARFAAFALSSRLFVADVVAGDVRELPAPGPVVDPRLDPTGRRVAFVANRALHVVDVADGSCHAVAEPDTDNVTWGLAEFIAAEEMDRRHGFWWAPDGRSLLAARVDESPVQRWWIADPEHPEREPVRVAYPAAGTADAEVRLFSVGLDGAHVEVRWDRERFPYLARVHWSSYGAPLVQVQTRDQRSVQVLAVDAASGVTELVAEDTDEHWVDLVDGVPAWTPDSRLVRVAGRDGTRRLLVGAEVATPDDVHVAAVLDVAEGGVLVAGTDGAPEQRHVWLAGGRGGATRITDARGVHSARRAGDLLLLTATSLDFAGTRVTVRRAGEEIGTIRSYAETPPLVPRVTLLRAGARKVPTAVLFPTGWEPGQGRLPVLMDPYGGPGAQRVLAASNAHLSSQWFADRGFAVVVADGRGTPGHDLAWERAIAFDVAGPVLQDQVDALHAVAEANADLDLDRVAIRGWSFGGYLAALAVLRRPDVFAAAVAGAPVTEWRLYDTHYTERYLGKPQEHPEAYDATSLIPDASRLERPLMLIHGLADDNVVAANTLLLSSALLAGGRAHTVLPLSGVTHMTPQEVVAENLLLLQVGFLKDALGMG